MADQAQQQVLAQQAHANEALKRSRAQTKIVNTSEGMDEISEDEDAGGEYLTGFHKKKKRNNKKNRHNIRLKGISWILVDRSLQ